MTISTEVTAKMQEARQLIIQAFEQHRHDGFVPNDVEMFRVLEDLKRAVIHQSQANGMTIDEIAGWAKMDPMDVHVVLAQPLVMPVDVGAIVRSKNPQRDPLHCGSGTYSQAVVICMDPFIMVSEDASMRWSTWSVDRVEAIGIASADKFNKCCTRSDK